MVVVWRPAGSKDISLRISSTPVPAARSQFDINDLSQYDVPQTKPTLEIGVLWVRLIQIIDCCHLMSISGVIFRITLGYVLYQVYIQHFLIMGKRTIQGWKGGTHFSAEW